MNVEFSDVDIKSKIGEAVERHNKWSQSSVSYLRCPITLCSYVLPRLL